MSDNNWTTEENDKKNWEGWLVTPPRIERIIKIRHAVTKLWQTCEEHYPPLPYYTPHGPAHAKSVEDIIHRLLPGKSYKKLKEIERYYLLAASWTHDIGMIRGINGKKDTRLHPDQIREEHHKRSENYIVNNYTMVDIEKKDSNALGLLAFFHRKREKIEDCPETFVVGTEMVRLRLLAAYLRLADALDVDQSRAPSSDYAICLAYNIPFTSKLHWIKSRLVSGIAVLPDEKRIHVNFKQPHEEDFKKFYSSQDTGGCKADRYPEEYDSKLLKRNLEHLQQNVVKDICKELDSVKTILIRGNITSYLSVTSESIAMAIDDQVRPEIIRLADDLDMIVHPSATRLILLLLDTVRHIIDRYLSSPDKGDKCNPDGCNPKDCKNNQMCQMPKLIKKEVKEFISEIKEQVLKRRKCHLGLHSIVERIDNKATFGSVSDVKKIVELWRGEIENERRKVRVNAYKYFKQQTEKVEFKKEWLFIEKRIKESIYQIIGLSCEQPDEKSDRCVTILLYGYSELVIKALSGFRDAIIQNVITSLHNEFTEMRRRNAYDQNLINNLHKIKTEEIASSVFRIFVCEGQPKTITEQNDTLQHHDGTRFAIALGRKGFKNVIIIPDLVAGRLLSGDSLNSPKNSHIDFILLGVNGLKIYENKPGKNIFLHSSGHISLAGLVNQCREKNKEYPRLVLVLSMSKCKIDMKDDEPENDVKPEEFEERQGYIFWRGYGEKTRKETFFARDAQVKKSLSEHKISIYNPREDRILLDNVNDIISDEDMIDNINSNVEKLTTHIKNYDDRIAKEENKINSTNKEGESQKHETGDPAEPKEKPSVEPHPPQDEDNNS